MPAFRLLLPIVLALGLAASSGARALPGNLDPTFGIGGKSVTPPIGGYQSWGHAEDSLRTVKALPGGKVLLAGVGRQGTRTYALAVRLNADGTQDTTFGPNGDGIARVELSGSAPDVADVAAHPTDGYVFLTTTNGEDLLLVSLDVTGQGSMAGFGAFGNAGVAPVSVPFSASLRARKIAWDGTRYLIGFEVLFAPGLAEDFAATRVNADGTPDGTWGTRAAGFQCAPVRLHAMRIDAAGRPVLAGQCQTVGPGAASQSIVTRFTSAGELDTTFNAAATSNRRAFDVEDGAEDDFRTLDIDASGRLLLSGVAVSALNGNQPAPFTLRLTPGGDPDTGYGPVGSGFAFYPGNAGGDYPAVALGSNGRVFFGGHQSGPIDRLSSFIALPDGGYDPAMNAGGFVSERNAENETYRYVDAVAANGRFFAALEMGSAGNKTWRVDWQDEATLAIAFGNTGNRSPSDPLRSPGASTAITFRPGGYIVAGSALDEAGTRRFAVAELDADGALTSNLGPTGRILLGQPGTARAAVVDSLGRIYLAGENDFGVATIVRLSSTGIPDATFGPGGSRTLDPTGEGGDIRAMALQADGKLVLAGRLVTGGVDSAWVARIETNGAFDTTFGTNGGYTLAGSGAAFGALLVKPDGKILAAGHTTVGGVRQFLVAQFLATGAFDTAFGSGGQVNYANGAFDNEARALALLPGGRLAVFGRYFDGSLWKGIGHRLLADGNLDGQFSTAVIAPTAGQWEVNAALAQPDGMLLLTGVGNEETLSARLLPATLEPDPSWVGGGLSFFSQFVTGGYALVHERGYGGVATLAVQGRNESQGAIRIQAPVVPNVIAYVNGPATLQVGVPGTFTITLVNVAGFAVQGFAGTIGYGSPAITNAALPSSDCPGLAFGSVGTGDLTLSGSGTPLADGASCTITLSLVASSAGSSTFEIAAGAITSASGGATNAGRAAMTVIRQGMGDSTPDPFGFVQVTGVAAGNVVTSAAVTITGIDVPSPVSVANGSYSIGCNGAFVATPGTITNGQSVCVEHVSALAANATTVTTLTIGGVLGTFASTTAPGAQAITFGALPDRVVDEPAFAVSASATSGLPVAITSLTPSVCSIAGGLVTLVTTGTCTLAADQPGDAGTAPAPRVTRSFTVTPAPGRLDAIALAAGARNACALMADRSVRCWGANEDGRLGDGTTTNRSAPVSVVGLPTGATRIAAGVGFMCAVTPEGAAKCWGGNSNGQLGDGTTTARSVPVDVVGLSAGVVQVAGGVDGACAVTAAGAVKCWGRNGRGENGDGTRVASLVPVDVVGLSSGVVGIAAGFSHRCALLQDGGIRCWGSGANGRLGNGATTDSNVPVPVSNFGAAAVAISASPNSAHTCALLSDGALRCWGSGAAGQLGFGGFGDQFIPAPVSGFSAGTTAFGVGHSHACAATPTGELRCWGLNDSGQLGNGTLDRSASPVPVSGLSSGVVAMSGGNGFSCALLAGGDVKCWGLNDFGQLGDGTAASRLEPGPIPRLAGDVDAPDSYAIAPRVDAARGAMSVSAPFTVAGFGQPRIVSIRQGEYSIGCTAAYTRDPGALLPGQALCVRRAASGDYGGTATATITVGGVSADFVTTTMPATAIPRLGNLSSLGRVGAGGNALFGGLVIGGTRPKTVVVRARGPSLASFGVVGPLADPQLQLFSGASLIGYNNDWAQAANAQALQSSGYAPGDAREAALLVTLAPGAYTTIVTGVGGATGTAILEVFEVDLPDVPLVNISTRGLVGAGNDVLIAGFVVQGSGPSTVIVRARGPSLTVAGIPNALANPLLQVFSGSTQIAVNDNWQALPEAAQVQAAGFAPANALESVVRLTLMPGAYTAIVSGAGGTTGVAIVEVFAQ